MAWNGAIHIEDREGLAVHFRDDAVARFHVGRACDPYELSHRLLPSFRLSVMSS